MQTQIDSILKELSKFLFERRFQFQGVYRMMHSKPYNLEIELWSKTISFDEFVFRDETTQPIDTLADLDDLMECRLYSFILNGLHREEKEYFERQIKKVRLLFKIQQSHL